MRRRSELSEEAAIADEADVVDVVDVVGWDPIVVGKDGGFEAEGEGVRLEVGEGVVDDDASVSAVVTLRGRNSRLKTPVPAPQPPPRGMLR